MESGKKENRRCDVSASHQIVKGSVACSSSTHRLPHHMRGELEDGTGVILGAQSVHGVRRIELAVRNYRLI